jgi:hypothetical protein
VPKRRYRQEKHNMTDSPDKPDSPDSPKPPSWLELQSVIPLESKKPDTLTAKKVTSLSAEALAENYADKIRRLSQKRIGMKLGDALDIAAGRAVKVTPST